MTFSVRMFPQMVLHVLHLEKENGNVLYHLPEKRVVPVEKQMKRSIFSGTCNCGQMVQKFPGIPVKTRKGNTSKGLTLFSKTIHRDEPFHLNSLRNFRKFHSNGKCSWSKNPTANQMACIAFSTCEEKDTSNQVPRIMFFNL